MIRVLGLKLLHMLPVLFLVSLATFFLIELVPGDPAVVVAGEDATPEQVAEIRSELGLDRSLLDRYVGWMSDTLSGDLGTSLVPPIQDVSDMITQRFPVTLQVTVMALALSLLIAIPAALISVYSVGSRFDRATTAGAFAAISVPSFLAALLLIYMFVFNQHLVRWALATIGAFIVCWLSWRIIATLRGEPPSPSRRANLAALATGAGVAAALTLVAFVAFPDFPRQGFARPTGDGGLLESLRTTFLPALTLALIEAAVFMRLLRSDLLTTLQEDYILSARAKGMPRWRILVRDALRPSSFSLITVAGLALGRLVGGTVIVEAIFNLPGMGTMLIQAIGAKDYAVVQGAVLVIAVFYVTINALVDISYSILDPRVRRG
jgi:peptide/nickel transport system permease protein